MARQKTKIVIEQTSDTPTYKVVSLTNRTRPLIGTELNERDVRHLMTESEPMTLTVEIKSGKTLL